MVLLDLPPDKKRQGKIKEQIEESLDVGPNSLEKSLSRIVVFDQTLRLSGLMEERTSLLGDLSKCNKQIADERIHERQKTGNDTNKKIKALEAERAEKQVRIQEIETKIQKVSDHLKRAEYYLTSKIDASITQAKQNLDQLRTTQKNAQTNEEQVKKTLAGIAEQIVVLGRTVPLTLGQQQDLVALNEQQQELNEWEKEWQKVQSGLAKTIRDIDQSIKDEEVVTKEAHAICNPEVEKEKTTEHVPTSFSVDDAKEFFKKNTGNAWPKVQEQLEALKKDAQYGKAASRILRAMKKKDVVGNSGFNGGILFEEFLNMLHREESYVLALAFSNVTGQIIKGKDPIAAAKKVDAPLARNFEQERRQQSEAFVGEVERLVNQTPGAFDSNGEGVGRLKVILDANRNNSPFWQKLVSELKKDLADHGNAGMLLSDADQWTLYDLVAALQALGYIHGNYENVSADRIHAGEQPDIAVPSSPRELAQALAEPDVSKLLARMTTNYTIYNGDNLDAYRIIHAFMHEHQGEVGFQNLLQQPQDEAAQSERFQALFEKQSEWLTRQDIADFIDVLMRNDHADGFWRNLVMLASGEHENLLDTEKKGQSITSGVSTTANQSNMVIMLQGRLNGNARSREYLQKQIDEVTADIASNSGASSVGDLHELRARLHDLDEQNSQIQADIDQVNKTLGSGHVVGLHAKYRGGISLEGIMKALEVLGLTHEESGGDDIRIIKWIPDDDDIRRIANNPDAARSLHWFIHATRMYDDLPVQSETIIKEKRIREHEEEMSNLTAAGLAATAFASFGIIGAIGAFREKGKAKWETEQIEQFQTLQNRFQALQHAFETLPANATPEQVSDLQENVWNARYALNHFVEVIPEFSEENNDEFSAALVTLQQNLDALEQGLNEELQHVWEQGRDAQLEAARFPIRSHLGNIMLVLRRDLWEDVDIDQVEQELALVEKELVEYEKTVAMRIEVIETAVSDPVERKVKINLVRARTQGLRALVASAYKRLEDRKEWLKTGSIKRQYGALAVQFEQWKKTAQGAKTILDLSLSAWNFRSARTSFLRFVENTNARTAELADAMMRTGVDHKDDIKELREDGDDLAIRLEAFETVLVNRYQAYRKKFIADVLVFAKMLKTEAKKFAEKKTQETFDQITARLEQLAIMLARVGDITASGMNKVGGMVNAEQMEKMDELLEQVGLELNHAEDIIVGLPEATKAEVMEVLLELKATLQRMEQGTRTLVQNPEALFEPSSEQTAQIRVGLRQAIGGAPGADKYERANAVMQELIEFSNQIIAEQGKRAMTDVHGNLMQDVPEAMRPFFILLNDVNEYELVPKQRVALAQYVFNHIHTLMQQAVNGIE